MDASHRVMLPVEWKPADPSVVFTLIPWAPWAKNRLLALTPSRWNQLVEKVRTFNLSDEEALELERSTVGVAQHVRMDKVGRICLGEDFRKSLNIGDQVRLIGLGDKFEIWDLKRWEERERQIALVNTEAPQLPRLTSEVGKKYGI